MTDFNSLVTRKVPTFYFIGVTTQRSSIMHIFPRWMNVLGRPDVVIEGVDLRINDQPEAYRQATAQIKYDPLSLGALVTTHKITLLKAARNLFDDLDSYAQLLGEVSSISKSNNRLMGHAKDPISVGLSMDAILGEGYFGRTEGSVLIFGAGGSGSAALLHLLNKQDPADRPQEIILVDIHPARLEHVQQVVDRFGSPFRVQTVRNADPRHNDRLVEQLPDGSLVINATGMGKDTPGSPLTDAAVFPYQGIAWEFNYRGELDFMHQAASQAVPRQLRVEDGWLYFLYGWTQVISQVLHIDITPVQFDQLRATAAASR